jgi:hypothetical protein
MAPPLARPRVEARSAKLHSSPSDEANNQRDNQKGEKQKEQDLRDAGRRTGYAAEAKHARNQGNHEEDQCVVEHVILHVENRCPDNGLHGGWFLSGQEKGRENPALDAM